MKLDTERVGVEFTLEREGVHERFETRFLAQYVVGVVMAARILANHFNISSALVKQKVARIAPVEHRLFPIKTPNGVLVIDDAYNGNPDGVREALDVLRAFEGRRRIVITPGLVEMGERMEEVHQEIARQLVSSAEKVVLIQTPASQIIKKELDRSGFQDVSLHKRAEDAHAEVREILKKDDVVLFQNDVAENYQ